MWRRGSSSAAAAAAAAAGSSSSSSPCGGTITNCLLQLSSLILLASILTSSYSKAVVAVSSCGNIGIISCPFHLRGDHQNCDNGSFSHQLECSPENRTIIYLPDPASPRDKLNYYVEDINYENSTVRLVDPGIYKDNCSSLPLHHSIILWYSNRPVTFIDCPTPVNNSRYLDIATTTATCTSSTNSHNNNTSFLKEKNYYFYVVVGFMYFCEVEDNCKVSRITLVSSEWLRSNKLVYDGVMINNLSFSHIHDGMAYGFQVSWYEIYCTTMCRHGDCVVNDAGYQCYYFPCSIRHLSSYKPSFYCVRRNLRDLGETLFYLRAGISKITGMVFGARFVCGMPFLIALLVYKMKRRHLSVYDIIEDFLQGQNNLMPIRYSYSEIKKITDGFKYKLGEGGYGTVYKGKLRSGLLVAVKVMGKSKATGQEFINEVGTIGRIHHVNVVQLMGFCFEGPKRALIYEFMPNGSLEKYIFSREEEEESISLSCQKMYEISSKVANGIEYLHRGCDMQILHFDIKPHNILLDEDFIPKISDFGLAKLYATDESIVNLTAARGTMGYMAPELFYKNIGGVSYKADVYSFGMLLMEMAGRRKNLNPFVDQLSQIYFPSWVYDQFNEGKEIEMEDACEEEMRLIKRMIITALWCIQLKPNDRPSMNKVIEMLGSDVELLVMPPKPFLCPQEVPAEAEQPIVNGTIQ